MAAVETQLQEQDQPDSLMKRALNLLLTQEGILLIILVIAIFGLSMASDKFFTVDNLLNQGRLVTEIGLVALPMTFIIITGGIDLSVGSVMGLTAILLGVFWEGWGLPLPVAVIAAIAVGTFGGFVNGWFIVRIGVPPLIMTLATLTFYRGLAEGISAGRSVRGYPEWFTDFGAGSAILGVPNQLWILIIAIIITAIILARTTLGRTLYAVGNNAVGARFSGLRVDRSLLFIYTFSGFMAALAGFIFVSRVTTTRSDMGTGLEMDAIAAVVLGGTSIMGGTGSIPGTVLGMILIQLLQNGMVLLKDVGIEITGDARIMVIGTVLILAILLNNFIQSRMKKA